MKSTSTLTRRGLLGIAASIPVVAGLPFGFVGEAHANDQPVSGDQPHGGGYYHFNIGKFKATVISDGYGNVPFWPILAANQESLRLRHFCGKNASVRSRNSPTICSWSIPRPIVSWSIPVSVMFLGPIPVISRGC